VNVGLKLALLLALGALAAGCGGGGSSGGSGGAGTSAGDLENAQAGQDANASAGEIGGTPAFRSGFTSCQLYPLEELARQNNAKPNPESVATAFASLESTAKDKKDVHDGCLKALKQK
jgi:transcription elongation factor